MDPEFRKFFYGALNAMPLAKAINEREMSKSELSSKTGANVKDQLSGTQLAALDEISGELMLLQYALDSRLKEAEQAIDRCKSQAESIERLRGKIKALKGGAS